MKITHCSYTVYTGKAVEDQSLNMSNLSEDKMVDVFCRFAVNQDAKQRKFSSFKTYLKKGKINAGDERA